MLEAIILWIITFLFLVVIHEFGHFIAAKLSGVKVLEFGIGIPPKIFTFYRDKSWTEYTINLLPLGWFVRPKGESPGNPSEFLAKDSFITQNIWKKTLILIWWVAMNLLFAYIFFVIAFWKWVSPLGIYPYWHSESVLIPSADWLQEQWWLEPVKDKLNPQIYYILTWSLAEKVGLQTGDIIISVNGENVVFLNNQLKDKIKQNCGKSINLQVLRNNELIDYNVDLWTWKNCMLGVVALAREDFKFPTIKFDFSQALIQWAKEIWWETKITFVALWKLISKLLSFDKQQAKEAVEQFAWPVGAVKIWQIIIEEFGLWQYLAFAGMISLALAIFNILPIPALDWWRLISVWIQAIFRLDPVKYFAIENWFNILFFVLLLGLWIYIIILDLQRFWWVW